MDGQSWLLLLSAAALGFRHGIDWDHIAAISDIVGTSAADQKPAGLIHNNSLKLSSLYALGHAAVVAVLGLCALYFAAILPAWVDPIMERMVGYSLLLLAVFVCISLLRHWQGKENFRLQSRWMLTIALIEQTWKGIWSKLTGKPVDTSFKVRNYGSKTAFGVGMIHGIGAETGTQVLILASLGGAAGHGLGPAMLTAFLCGLLASNTLLALIGTSSFMSAKRNHLLYLATGAITCCFSLFVGTYFALGRGEQLPDLQHLLGDIKITATVKQASPI